jgi:hypothetical protein
LIAFRKAPLDRKRTQRRRQARARPTDM